ncbi:MAG: tRNA (adenosine(37)-N6)-threonylcarbamoyltransferase complex dimerization subunit type 1 TsaB [Gemmataceae bacterium]|nr:tRNA (adenosine(37)-N6)-threonylcarbamoyltransferase complex dimerization subunit type 1 TsaB [Gemmata sp.]MDW8197661.1 tRNA (adenosine(37)-N6)-threonylcarbamoyltransferase complex dimerization subunit type 1 TsaB [Gemmataceae bacterium]
MRENWLILETSGPVARLGLIGNGVVLGRADLPTSRRHAREIVPTIDTMMRKEGLTPRQLTGVMVGRGPGSYTGLRVGLATAKALAYALGCQLRAVDTFAAIAEQTPEQAAEVWVIADGLQNQVYVQKYARMESGWTPVQPLRICGLAEWREDLRTPTHISGPGVAVYGLQLPPHCQWVPESDREARIESVFAVGSRLAALTWPELFALEPLYLRGSSAEEKLAAPPA